MGSEKSRGDGVGRWIPRRGFIGGVAAAASVAIVGCGGGESDPPGREEEPYPQQWWVDGKYVVHAAVNSSRLKEGIVRARIDGAWRDVKIVELPRRFVEWSLTERMARLERLARDGFDPRDLDGPHNACVATYGGWERGSSFSLNTAYKGMGFTPTPDRLEETLAALVEAGRDIDARGGDFMVRMARKTEHLATLYADASRFDLTKQVSLELLTEPGFATHTFLNMMANPVASASFLAYPTFELRTVPQLLHPDDPGLSPYQVLLVEYTNAVHNFVHGGDRKYMACVYHVAEVYDDTPNDTGGGKRIA